MYTIKFYILIFIILIDNVQTRLQTFPFDTIVTFGDSNTDTGNVYNLTGHLWPLVPPYYQGRFTNGPVWIENIDVSNIANYAYGDATIDNDNLVIGFTGPNKTIVPSIRQQIVNYLTVTDISKTDLSRTLHIIWAGGNEYLIDPHLSSDTVITSLLTAIDDLLVVGIQHLIVINLPPLQSFPGANQNQRLSTLINQHNNYLSSNLTQIQSDYTKVSIRTFDLYSSITEILSNNSIYTLNKNDKCWNIIDYRVISQCTNPNEYVFIDDYHFTSVIHQVIANNIQNFILSSAMKSFSCSKFYALISMIVFIIKKF
ncbi:unnamed protein product [Rotaria sp. Silwood2]|nr:unnamed protein product [Rotaria sp. Silwood2]CAF2517232.1 unnamed protein product [Rotaria sp. Silwood2]CAF2753753.1 unnamed protein product [Rotaria sp. Silwood2]CAF2912787.1 unnamed protein product [Rotaria sp. Silwood2]CAF3852305.1 unnamed protein product [Rotaria sp. Silwood2]